MNAVVYCLFFSNPGRDSSQAERATGSMIG
jgi:hypothetical protein